MATRLELLIKYVITVDPAITANRFSQLLDMLTSNQRSSAFDILKNDYKSVLEARKESPTDRLDELNSEIIDVDNTNV